MCLRRWASWNAISYLCVCVLLQGCRKEDPQTECCGKNGKILKRGDLVDSWSLRRLADRIQIYSDLICKWRGYSDLICKWAGYVHNNNLCASAAGPLENAISYLCVCVLLQGCRKEDPQTKCCGKNGTNLKAWWFGRFLRSKTAGRSRQIAI